MSDLGVGGLRGSHRTRHRPGKGCLAVLVALVVIAGLGVFAYVKGVELIKDALSDPADYSGDGSGRAVVTIAKGDRGVDIASTLVEADVVKSEEAFADAYNAHPDATSIMPGKYQLRRQMSAESAVDLLLDPDSVIETPTVTVPEGLHAKEILALVVEETDFTRREVQRAYADTEALGLPSYAEGDPEGFLYPSTYEITDQTTAASLLAQMVTMFTEQTEELALEQKARQLGYSPHDIVVIASLVQAEAANAEDMMKVASVVYNRLDVPQRLEFDSAPLYAVESRGAVVPDGGNLTDVDSPYNTYRQEGLTPTPIDSPGLDALTAALEPADTTFLYFVTVDLATGETRFATSFAEHQRNVTLYREYCETSDAC